MGGHGSLGEFEQLVLLAILRLENGGGAAEVRREIQERARRRASRGALYATLDRLEQKGFVSWETESTTPARGGIPKRRFAVTPRGVEALRESQEAILRLSAGLTQVPIG
ncbi:MAG: helix-turn-helix transcriptional regulator [Gemmatimonadota bacterium]|nr:helix-turn-helix transcriptional regulator [Gemmatimonadota bacterium]